MLWFAEAQFLFTRNKRIEIKQQPSEERKTDKQYIVASGEIRTKLI